jgi:hypothetical protein
MVDIELRLYYDDQGNVLFYTCDKPEGNYIVIDTQTYAECRMDLKVIDGKLIRNTATVVFKLVPSIEGIRCVSEDISIIAPDDFHGQTVNWKTKIYET